MSQNSTSMLESLQADPENWQLRRAAAEALAEEGSESEAATLVVDTPVVPPTEEDLIFSIDLIASVDLDQASQFANQVLEADGENPEAHVGKAFACWLGGDAETAQAWYEQAQGMQEGFHSPTFEKLVQQGAEHYEEDAGSADATHQPDAAEDDESEASMPFNVTPAAPIAVAQSVPAPSAAAAPAPAAVTPPAPAPSVPEAPLSEQEQAELTAADDDAHLAELVSHAAKRKDTTEKTTALTVAVVAHLVILALLTIVIVAPALLPPPEIVAVTAPAESESELETRQVAPVVQRTPAAPSSPATKIISSTAPSSAAVAAVDFAPETDTPDLGSSFGSGFGFGGAGVGMGGGGMPDNIKSRCSRPERLELLAKHGGTTEVESKVDKALDWFKTQQNSDGSWGSGKYEAAMTGFVLLCYLGRCETPDSPRYGDTVMNGIMYLVELGSRHNGLFTANPGNRHYPYEHGICTYALGETYAMARMGNRRLPGVREAFEKGVEIILNGQTDKGGWNYGYSKGGRNDTSLTGWQYQALKAAANTQLPFEDLDDAIDAAGDYLETVQGESGAFGYTGKGNKPTLAGLGTLGLQMVGRGSSRPAKNGVDFIREHMEKDWKNTVKVYPLYYNTQAMFNAGGSDWKAWNERMLPMLMETQNDDGSWTSPGGGGSSGSQYAGSDADIYQTAMCTLMLEIYYRYLPAGSDMGGGGSGRGSTVPAFESRFD